MSEFKVGDYIVIDQNMTRPSCPFCKLFQKVRTISIAMMGKYINRKWNNGAKLSQKK